MTMTQKYLIVKTRDGRDAKILAEGVEGLYDGKTIVAQIGESVFKIYTDGRFSRFCESSNDLMIEPPFRVTQPGRYRRRDGSEDVVIEVRIAGSFPVIGIEDVYTVEGRVYLDVESPTDLVAQISRFVEVSV